MVSVVPITNTLRPDEEYSVPDGDELIGSKTFELNGISSWYNLGLGGSMEGADDTRRYELVAQWYKWCDHKYPATKLRDWPGIASAAGKDVDIRLLTRGYPIAGFAVLIFLEACYDVDKVLCGTDLEALAHVKVWHMPHEMKAYKYLLSHEMKLWWERELAELENEINSPFPKRVYLSLRIRDLQKCLITLEHVMDCGEGMGTNIWTTMEEEFSDPPAGLSDAIYDRVEILKISIEILRKALERSEQRDVAPDIFPSANHRSVELNVIRRRIPYAASASINEYEPEAVHTSTVNEENIAPESDVVPSTRTNSLLEAMPLIYLQSIFKLVVSCVEKLTARYKANRLVAWLAHKETALVVSFCLVVISVFFMAVSVILAKSQSTTSPKQSLVSDPSFFGDLSQFILSNLSIYLIIAKAVHDQSVGLYHQSWLWFCLCISSLSSILGLSLYSSIPIASIMFLWASAFAQVVIPVLFIINTGKLEFRNSVDVERDGN